ncbi:MAG: hypothetical protein E7290_03530 [Lachnospiraceae bacterium]|nr:hypothetical protein [Lachnospiraceae bacterium]
MKVRNAMYKLLAGVMAVGLLVTSGSTAFAVKAAENTQTVSAQMPFRELTADEMVAEMGSGWNLGNTMDGHTGFTPNETLWQNVETTQALLKAVHDNGFNTVRVPVTWGTMIDDENGYAINEAWISRVQDIVDYCVNMNMYVIINIHHDGAEQSGWLRIGADDQAPVQEKFEAVWRHIAERFKDYDEHVIFESMNEVTGDDGDLVGDTANINALNQIFVDTVRATGSNNAIRWLSVPGRYTNIVNTTKEANGFKLPSDSVKDRLFVAVHYYDWNFGLLDTMQTTEFNDKKVSSLVTEFHLLDKFYDAGIPLILGEYGAMNKMNTMERAYHYEVVNRLCRQLNMVPVYWDQGWYDLTMEPDYSFSIFDRETCEPIYPEIIAGIHRGLLFEGSKDLTDIIRNTTVTPITDLGKAEGEFELIVGQVGEVRLPNLPKNAANDIVLWKSADETVATVNQNIADSTVWAANIHATGIGQTVITAYSHNGGAVLEIPVIVSAVKTVKTCTAISTEKESYSLTAGQSVFMNAAMTPADTDAFLTYRSSNSDVVSVSKLGKLVAKAEGSAQVIITSSDGMVKVVPVTVEAAAMTAEIEMALNVYFNDSEHNFFSNEYGKAITIAEDGQYTLSFDCTSDLSDNAKNAGVTGLNNLTAVYIKDHGVTLGQYGKSPLISCDITYDSVVVDGKALTVTKTDAKSAIKASGILDTNDPINSWDGSAVEEVTVSNHVLNFTAVDNPQKVEVTFTISNLVFDEAAMVVEKEAATDIDVMHGALSVKEGSTVEMTVQVTPADSSKVTFVSSNPAIASVSNIASEATKAVIYGHQAGEATITVYTENGLSTEVKVTVKEAKPVVEESKEVQSEIAKEETKESEPVTQATIVLSNEADSSTMNTVLLVIGILLFGVAVFFVTLKIAGSNSKK